MSGYLLALYLVSYALLVGLSVTLGLHRALSHRSVTLRRWLEYIFVTVALPAGTPIQWVGTHRCHHRYTDQEGDPHSPTVGFWHAHVGGKYLGHSNTAICVLYSLAGPIRMLFDAWHRPRTNQEYNDYAQDISADPYYRFVSAPGPYFVLCALHPVITLGFAGWAWGWSGVAGIWVIILLLYSVGDGLSSFGHLYGARIPGENHHARNHWILGWLALGDGWHANHHAFSDSARHGLLPGQFDFTWIVICLMSRLGWVTAIRLPQPEIVVQKLSHASTRSRRF